MQLKEKNKQKNDLLVHDKTSQLVKGFEGNVDARIVYDKFIHEMLKRDIRYTKAEKQLAKLVFFMFMREQQIGSPVVIALPPSFGKSTALELFAVHMAEYAPFFGMVVVKDERKQVSEYCREVNERAGRMIAFPLLGKSEEMTQGEYKNQFDNQRNFPVLVMTKAMFESRSSMNDVERFAFWTDRNGETRRRSQLIFDEPPKFETSVTFTAQKLTEFMELVRQFSFRADGSQSAYFEVILDRATRVRMALEDPEIKTGFIQAIDSDFELPSQLVSEWSYKYEGKDSNLLKGFEQLVKFGGYKKSNNKVNRIGVAFNIHLSWTAFNPFILDGTGHIDKAYDKFNFPTLSLVEEEGKYENVKFLYYSLGGQYSKKAIREKKNSLESISKTVSEVASKYQSTMVVCHSEFYEDLKELLYYEIIGGQVKLRWFNNGRSTNDFDKCDSAIFIGELNKGEEYYHSIAKLRNERAREGVITGKGGLKFADKLVKEVYLNETTVERIQDVHRLRPRNRKAKLDIYFIGKNDDLLSEVQKHFSGSEVEWFIPEAKGINKAVSKESFMRFLKEMNTGDNVKASYVYKEVLGVSTTQWKRLKLDPEILALMDSLGVSFQGHGIIKN